MIVATHHGLTTFAGPPDALGAAGSAVFLVTMEYLSNPGMAVLFFFVLSGYVLGRSFERDSNYPAYIVRRCFRILPAFIVAVLFGYACLTSFRINISTPDLSNFFKSVFWPDLSIADLWDNLFFRSSRPDGPTWSIPVEMRGSIWLPAFVILHRWTPKKIAIPLFAAASYFILFSHNRLTNSVTLFSEIEYFYAGYFLPPLVASLMPNYWLARAATFGAGYWIILTAGNTDASYLNTIIPASIGGSLMIGAVVSSGDFLNWLRWAPIRFLGRVSYSFYLLHFTIFYLIAIYFASNDWLPRNMVGNVAISALSVAVALALSAATYAIIEQPAINAGRWVTSFFALRGLLAAKLAGRRAGEEAITEARCNDHAAVQVHGELGTAHE